MLGVCLEKAEPKTWQNGLTEPCTHTRTHTDPKAFGAVCLACGHDGKVKDKVEGGVKYKSNFQLTSENTGHIQRKKGTAETRLLEK